MSRVRPGAPVVLKFGGELLEDTARMAALASAIASLGRKPEVPLVIVHGGGREIDASLARAGIEKRQVDGLRITDAPTLDVVVGVLAGLINTRFVAALVGAGVRAVGLTGADWGVGRVKPAPPHKATSGEIVDLGRVGEPVGKDTPELLIDLCRGGYVPVVSSIGASRAGVLFNVNADTLAAHLAGRLRSPRLIIAGATPGVLDERGATIPEVDTRGVVALVKGGAATAGMVAKLAACRSALSGGAREVFVADGKDLAGLTVLARYGQAAGAAKSTRIYAQAASSRKRTVDAKRRGAKGPRKRSGPERGEGPPRLRMPA